MILDVIPQILTLEEILKSIIYRIVNTKNQLIEGMTAQHNATSNSTAATYWCNDGIKNLRLKNGTPLPDGFSLGRIKWK